MQVRIGEVGSAGERFTLADSDWLPVEGVEVAGVSVAEVVARARDNESIILVGRLVATIMDCCSRCGQPVDYPVEEQFHYLATVKEEEFLDQAERECRTEDCDMLYLRDPVVDLAEILREQLLLAIPARVLCSPDCKGICHCCGKRLEGETCNCAGAAPDSPFAVLGSLKKR